MNSILKMKKNPHELLAKLKGEAEKQTKGGKKDTRFWSPTFDKEKGTGAATIRFLPALSDDSLPWTQIYYRTFKGPSNQWYFENDLRTIGRKDDPVWDLSKRLYASGIKSDEAVAKNFKQKVKYIVNVLVVKDAANPDAEGKVFLYEFGQQVMDVINAARDPKFTEDDEGNPIVAIEPFNPWFGANLRLKMIGKEMEKGKMVPNYETSTFLKVTAMADTDEEILEICGKGYNLAEFTAADQFKTAEELRRQMFEVLGPTVGSGVETVPGWGNKSPTLTPKKNAVAKAVADEIDEGESLDDLMNVDSDVTRTQSDVVTGDTGEERDDKPSTPATNVDDMEFMQNLLGD